MNTNWGLTASTQSTARKRGQQLTQRVLLYPGELYRVAPFHRQIQVVQGTAYLSHGGKDYFVRSGETVKFEQVRDIALVSPVRGEALLMEFMM